MCSICVGTRISFTAVNYSFYLSFCAFVVDFVFDHIGTVCRYWRQTTNDKLFRHVSLILSLVSFHLFNIWPQEFQQTCKLCEREKEDETKHTTKTSNRKIYSDISFTHRWYSRRFKVCIVDKKSERKRVCMVTYIIIITTIIANLWAAFVSLKSRFNLLTNKLMRTLLWTNG